MNKHQYTEAERTFIVENVSRGRAWIADQLGLSFTIINGYFSRNKLRTGVDTRFKKGEQRGHRIQKGQRISPGTQFKKGNVPPQTAPQGDRTVRIRTDNRGVQIHFIRVKPKCWVPLSRYVWETFFGIIPAGQIVVFRDGNALNPHPDNLMLLDRNQHVRRNGNRPKFSLTLRQLYAAGKINNPMQQMNDGIVAGWLFPRDPVTQQYVRERLPELITVARTNFQLKRELKNYEQ